MRSPKGLRTAGRYWAFQLPGTAVVVLLSWALVLGGWIAESTALLLLVAWIIKDAALYPFVRHAYAPLDGETPMGMQAVVTEALCPEGRVRVRGESWRARSASAQSIVVGASVRVRGREGLLLLVEVED